MTTKDNGQQVDRLIEQLEQASIASASGDRSWHQFGDFLNNFEALSSLHDPKNCDVVRIVRRKKICYYIAGDQADKSPQTVATVRELLPRVRKLIDSELFPSCADLHVLCDWLEQVIFLFETIAPETNKLEEDFVKQLELNLVTSCKLIELCIGCLKREIIHQSELDKLKSHQFERICPIAKLGVSQQVPLDFKLKTIGFMMQVARLMKETQFASTLDSEKFNLIASKLWSIVQTDLRDFVVCSYIYWYKISKIGQAEHEVLKEATLELAKQLPGTGEALNFFLEKLKDRSSPETTAADLAILNSILITKNYPSDGLCPVLDIHMGRSDPIVRDGCLDVVIGLVKNYRIDWDRSDYLDKYLNKIIADVIHDESQEHHSTRIKLVQLLMNYRMRFNNQSIFAGKLDKVLKLILAQSPNEHNVNLATQVMKKFETNIDLNALLTWACDHFKSIYRSGDAQSQVALLRALYEMIMAPGCDSGRITKNSRYLLFVQIVESGCDGVAPKGCNQAMFSLLKTARLCVADDDRMHHLVPIARVVYDDMPDCKLDDWLLGRFKENSSAFEKDTIGALLQLCHKGLSKSALCLRMGGIGKNCSYCEFAIEVLGEQPADKRSANRCA